MSFAQLAQLNQTLIRLNRCDRDTFWGRQEILEWIMEEEHAKDGKQWRKFGRYGNILWPPAFYRALDRLKDECHFNEEEMLEQYNWLDSQGHLYNNPDQLVATVFFKAWLEKNFSKTP